MDGGRVLRRPARSPHAATSSATVLAVRIGRIVGLAMVLVGLRFDMWLSIIGVFVLLGAGGERQAAAVRTAQPDGLKVADVMVHDSDDPRGELSAVGRRRRSSRPLRAGCCRSSTTVATSGLVAADRLPGPSGALLGHRRHRPRSARALRPTTPFTRSPSRLPLWAGAVRPR